MDICNNILDREMVGSSFIKNANEIHDNKYDSIKDSFCRDNNIKLIRIPYTEFNNINKIISIYV